jgi:hypothetical protein
VCRWRRRQLRSELSRGIVELSRAASADRAAQIVHWNTLRILPMLDARTMEDVATRHRLLIILHVLKAGAADLRVSHLRVLRGVRSRRLFSRLRSLFSHLRRSLFSHLRSLFVAGRNACLYERIGHVDMNYKHRKQPLQNKQLETQQGFYSSIA